MGKANHSWHSVRQQKFPNTLDQAKFGHIFIVIFAGKHQYIQVSGVAKCLNKKHGILGFFES